MPHSRQAFSAPSKQMPGSNPKGDLNSTASISVSSTISIPSSEQSASKPRDSTLKREQNPRYRHDNGLSPCGLRSPLLRAPTTPGAGRPQEAAEAGTFHVARRG